MNLYQLKIPRRQKKCCQCSASFELPAHIVSLIKGDEEAPVREDYCAKCFSELPKEEDVWGHWETHLKKRPKPSSVDVQLMDLFIEKIQGNEEKAACFLAHYLKRRQQLILCSELKKDGLVFFEDPKSSEVYTLKSYHMSYEEAFAYSKDILSQVESK